MCSWKSSSWMTGRKTRGVHNTEHWVSAFVAHSEHRPRGGHSRAHSHLSVQGTNGIPYQRLSPQKCHAQLPQTFVSLTKATIHIPCLWGREHSTSFFASVLYSPLAGATKTIKEIEDFNPAIVRKESAFCWHSQLAKLEWCHFCYPPPSWRILALVRLALKCFTLLLRVFSLLLLTPSLNPVQQSLCSDSTCKRAFSCLVSSSWE